jgi:tetratricopeptide (TPR) repeat protein
MIIVVNDPLNLDTTLATARLALDRGDYPIAIQGFQSLLNQVDRNSSLGAEVQFLLVTAYAGAGQKQAAIDLCQRLQQHPDHHSRKQAQDLLYILKAPALKRPETWMSQIPDLSQLEERSPSPPFAGSSKPIPEAPTIPGPTSNRFVAIALGLSILALLIWLGRP